MENPSKFRKHASEIDVAIGRRVKARRRALGITMEKLATAIGVSFQQIQKYENGKNRISGSMFVALGEALGVPAGYFFPAESLDVPPETDLLRPRLAGIAERLTLLAAEIDKAIAD